MEASDTHVLVVDDDDAVRMLCSVNLEIEGVSVLEASDGLRALALARTHRPALVLTDVSMPGLDGFELAAALRADARTSAIPLIFLTGEETVAHRARADALGALAYLTKPFDPRAVAALVAETVFGSAAMEEPLPAA